MNRESQVPSIHDVKPHLAEFGKDPLIRHVLHQRCGNEARRPEIHAAEALHGMVIAEARRRIIMRLPAPLSALWEPFRVCWLSAWMPPIRVAEPAFPLRATGGLLSLPRIALHSGRGGCYPGRLESHCARLPYPHQAHHRSLSLRPARVDGVGETDVHRGYRT